ncbi:hypothetical protein [Streptomyces sp. NPDC090080]|uniref:hypothetical protein n=1 Tax=Streptomyces sp. NPDC090080 TaxID=3365939 RepID=UPI0037FB6E12
MDWYPEADEDLLVRTAAKFAAGISPTVAGSRWFRDPDRNDIQQELSGWPAGPTYELHATGDRVARRTGRAFAVGIPLIANIIANIGGAAGSPFGDVPVRGRPEEPENEVEDFPVMFAAPGTLARTVPWQLDPARRPKGYATDLALTSRRLLFLGTKTGTLDKADVLAEFPREALAGAKRMTYSEAEADVRLSFADKSWIRLFTGNPDSAERLCQLLSGTVQTVTEAELSPGHRARLTRFLAELPGRSQPPVLTRLRSGIIMVEVSVPSKASESVHETHSILMGPSGEAAAPKPGDL